MIRSRRTRSHPSAFILEGTRSNIVARELSKTGIYVSLGETTRPPINLVSRYVDEFVLLPSYQETEEYVEALSKKIVEFGDSTLLPCSTVTVGIVSYFSKYLKSMANFLVPSPEAMSIAFDKLQCLKAAKRAGVPVPETREFTDPNDVDNFPQVVKPRFETGASRGFSLIRDKSDAERAFSEKKFGPLLLQEYIPGSSRQMRCCDMLFDSLSRPKAIFTMRKYLEFPVTGERQYGGSAPLILRLQSLPQSFCRPSRGEE